MVIGGVAAGLSAAGLKVIPPQTNVVYVEVGPADTEPLKVHLESRGIIATVVSPRMRLMTHLDLQRAKIDTALQAFRDYFLAAAI